MTSDTATAYAVSPDSGEHWTAPGAWPVAEGIHRIPLPLPMDGLKAVNVYALEVEDGLVLVDGGWSIPAARELLEQSLRSIGSGFGEIRRFLVTHVHRDHYTMARVLGSELGVDVALGRGEQPSTDVRDESGRGPENPFGALLRSAGADDVAEEWAAHSSRESAEQPAVQPWWQPPDSWLDGDHEIDLGTRVLDAVETPGHTPGHYVFADRPAGLLLAGDHVLPTITPSIGFTVPPVAQPLGDFMASLTKVRAMPDLRVLPAHGPVSPSSHARVDQLLAHHEQRLGQCLAALAAGPLTSAEVAAHLGWTRHEHAYADLDVFNRGLAAMETKAHLELLVARGQATRTEDGEGLVRFAAVRAARP